MKVTSRMGTEDDNQNSILKGILQNGSSFNYPGVCNIKVKIYFHFSKSLTTFQNIVNLIFDSSSDDILMMFIFSRSFWTCSQAREGKDNSSHGVFKIEEHGESSDDRDGGWRQDHRDSGQGPLWHLWLHCREDQTLHSQGSIREAVHTMHWNGKYTHL